MTHRFVFLVILAFVYPLSLLPLSVLYLLSDFLFLLVYYVFGFRKKIVLANLRNAFPEKSGRELSAIAKKFYRNLCDIIVENIKMVSISKEEVKHRCIIKGVELLDNYFAQGKSVVGTIGHCGNWEMAGLATSLTVKHKSSAFYRSLKNPHFDRFVRKQRARFGMTLLPHTKVRKMLNEHGNQMQLYIFITDQTPSNAATSHWLTFLNQDTPVYKGAEKMAKLTGLPVVFGDIQRIKRGYYIIEVSLLAEDSSLMKEGKLTELHTRALEKSIILHPDNWLWTHRRWKRKRPDNIKAQQH